MFPFFGIDDEKLPWISPVFSSAALEVPVKIRVWFTLGIKEKNSATVLLADCVQQGISSCVARTIRI